MGEDTQQDESAVLTIHGVTRADAGVYRCTADNGIGRPGSTDVQLVVQCECLLSDGAPPLTLKRQQIEMAARKYVQWKHINCGERKKKIYFSKESERKQIRKSTHFGTATKTHFSFHSQ